MSACPATQCVLRDAPALLPARARVVVACSGGPDSQALLSILAQQRTALQIAALWAVGIDHGLRPDAGAELDHAAALARQHGIAFCRIRVAPARAGNILQNARQARYHALREFARARNADAVAVGHTADDQLETVIHHLCRGCGLTGAAGMHPKRGLVIRPLLRTTRPAVLAHLQAADIAYATDPTNKDARFVRPRLRAAVAPALHGVNVRAAEHVAAFADRAQQDDALLWRLARRRLQRTGGMAEHAGRPLRAAAVNRAPRPLALRMLVLWLHEHGAGRLDSRVLDALWQARQANAARVVRRRLHVLVNRGWYWWQPQAHAHPWAMAGIGLPIPGKVTIPGWEGTLEINRHAGGLENLHQTRNKPSIAVAFDADRLHFGLELRLWRPSDRLRPFGLDGTIKVGDLFTNTKIPSGLRATWPLVTHGRSVLWVVGLRRGSDAPVTRDTRRVVCLKFQGALPWSAC